MKYLRKCPLIDLLYYTSNNSQAGSNFALSFIAVPQKMSLHVSFLPRGVPFTCPSVPEKPLILCVRVEAVRCGPQRACPGQDLPVPCPASPGS